MSTNVINNTTPETTTETTPETTTEVVTITPNNWREKVFLPESFSIESQEFLDKHVTKGILSRTGSFTLKVNVGETVPYELCPPRVKRMMQKINDDGDLPRTAFKSQREYQTVLINLHIYGYLQELKDKSLMEKRRLQAAYLKKWGRDNSEATKRIATNANKYRSKWRNEMDLLKNL